MHDDFQSGLGLYRRAQLIGAARLLDKTSLIVEPMGAASRSDCLPGMPPATSARREGAAGVLALLSTAIGEGETGIMATVELADRDRLGRRT